MSLYLGYELLDLGRLGHTQSKITQEVYTHVLPDAERRAAEIMEQTILGPVSET